MSNFDKTMSFKVERDQNIKVKEILKRLRCLGRKRL